MNASEPLKEAPWTRLARETGKYESLSNGELHAWRFQSKGRTKATLVCLHGIQTHGAWFAPLASELTPHGYSLWCPDRRGSGLSVPTGGKRTADTESAQMWLNDLDQVVVAARKEGAPVFLIGTSWGARPALAYAQEQGNNRKVKAVALVVPAFWTTADSPLGLLFAPILRWFGWSVSLEKRLPPSKYLPESHDVAPTASDSKFLADMVLDNPLLAKRVTFRALDEANRLSKMALQTRPKLPTTIFIDSKDALVKREKTEAEFKRRGIRIGEQTSSGHGIQVIAADQLAHPLRSWLESQLNRE